MQNKIIWVALAVILVAVLAGAGPLYKQLSADNTPTLPPAQTQAAEAELATTAAPETTQETASDVPHAQLTQSGAADSSSAPSVIRSTLPGTSATDPTTQTTSAPNKNTAPDMTVLDMNGDAATISSHFGKPLVLNFWATWCGPCRSELPGFNAAAKQYAGQIDFMMINLTDGYNDTVESVQMFVRENGYTFPVYFDTQNAASTAYSVYSIPLSVFINSDGTIQRSYIGSMSEDLLGQFLEELS